MPEWKMKVNESNAPVIDDKGRILYVDPDGKELPLDPVGMYNKISDLGKENQKHREKYDQVVNTYVKPFEGVDDIAKWKEDAQKALDTVANFNDKDWMKAEKVEQLKAEMRSSYEDKMKQKDIQWSEKEKSHLGEVEKLSGQIRKLLVSNKFATSKYFNGKDSITILPAGIAEDHFGKYVKVEANSNGEPITRVYYSNNDLVLSKINPGEPAEFEEAIGLVIDAYPGKEGILRSSSGGSGSTGGSGSNDGDASNISQLKKQYDQAMKDGNGKLAIVLKNKIFTEQQRMR